MSDLPFLPGMGQFREPERKSYAKKQRFGVKGGVMVTDQAYVPATKRPGPSQLETSVNIGKSGSIPDRPAYNPPDADGKSSGQPSWVAFDSKVLRFFGFFKEPVHSSSEENYRVRIVTIKFFLEDGSMEVIERRQDNSGIPQGTLIKRHRFPKSDEAYFTMNDLKCGTTLRVYGRTFRLCDCDAFTRSFYEDRGKDVGESEPLPEDPFLKSRSNKKPKSFNKQMNSLKTFMEANTGRAYIDVAASKQFLRNEGKVLRFFCTWADPSAYGEERPYTLKLYLADDTIEVSEVRQANSGRDPVPCLLKRSKLPKDYRNAVASVATIGDRASVDIYKAEDLRVGKTINVFGREIIIRGADPWTQEWYKKNYGLTDDDFPQYTYEEPVHEVPQREPPPKDGLGIGSEEDSLASWKSLVPHAPKGKRRNEKFEDKNMCFTAAFTNPAVEDRERRFVITYFMVDDTVSIFETIVRNSGFPGGKFLQRSKLNAIGADGYGPGDFYVGNQITLNSFKFDLLAADEFTFSFMESEPRIFPRSDAEFVMENLRAKGLDEEAARQLFDVFKAADSDGSGKLDRQEFANLLANAGHAPPDMHQLETLLRKFDSDGDGLISFVEFVNAVVG